MTQHVEVLSDKAALVRRAIEVIVELIRGAIADRDGCTIALSGGSTPKPIYEGLAQQGLPWDKLHIFWGDERYVSADHPDSNQRLAREAWLDRVDFPAANLHPMPTRAGDPAADAETYERHLREFFKLQPGDFPVFDIMLLGMGDDGHTASLFPQTDALQVCDRAVTVGHKDGQPRLTLTVPTINLSRDIVFAIAGDNKRSALTQVFASEGDDDQYPSRLVQPVEGRLWWLLDAAAGEPFQPASA